MWLLDIGIHFQIERYACCPDSCNGGNEYIAGRKCVPG